MKKNETRAISKEVAISELTKFLQKYKRKEFRKGELTEDKIEDNFPDVIEAIQDGLIVFDDKNHPTLTLRFPIETENKDKDLGIYVVNFRSRIKPSDKANIMDGLNIQTQQGKYILKFMSYITGMSGNELDKLDTEDYDTINQICSVF
tara:strand:+ start:5474 stop:5917 length:444 start_codon:yes stop_codon:yes gene_type:complete